MNKPLVSIICICKNRSAFIRQCVESMLNQDYGNFEFLIQDGASTDGTVEIIREYRDDRIKLISEPDSGPGEAIIRVLGRIRGEIWGSCLSDEELLPHAVGWAVENFAGRPETAMIYGDCYIINENGALIESIRTQPWDYEKYLCCELVPPFSATFFRTDCFRKIGYDQYNGCGEFDIWLRMGRLFQIEYIPEFVSKFRRHKGGNTSSVTDFYKTLPNRIAAIENIVDAADSPSHIRALKQEALAGLHLWVAENFLTNGNIQEAGEMIVASFNFAPRTNRLLPLCRTYIEKVARNSLAETCMPMLEKIAQYVKKREQSEPFTETPAPGRATLLSDLARDLPDEAVVIVIGPYEGSAVMSLTAACDGTRCRIYSVGRENNHASVIEELVLPVKTANGVFRLGNGPKHVLSRWAELTGGPPIDLAVISDCKRFPDALSEFCMTFTLVKTGGWVVFDTADGDKTAALQFWDDIVRHALSNHGRYGSVLFGQKTSPLPRWIENYVNKLMVTAEVMRPA